MSRSGWRCELELLADGMARQLAGLCKAMQSGLTEDEASFASDARAVLAGRLEAITSYEAARWPATRLRRALAAGSSQSQEDAVPLVELLGGKYDGACW